MIGRRGARGDDRSVPTRAARGARHRDLGARPDARPSGGDVAGRARRAVLVPAVRTRGAGWATGGRHRPAESAAARQRAPCARCATLLADPACRKAGHNIKYDWLVLRRSGVELAGVAYDSMLAAFVLDPGRRSFALDELARDRLNVRLRTYGELAGRGRSEREFAAVPLAEPQRATAATTARPCCGCGMRWPRSSTSTGSSRLLDYGRDAARAGAGGHGVGWRPGGPRPTGRAVARVRGGAGESRAPAVHGRGRGIQPQFHAAAALDPVQQAAAARSSRRRRPARPPTWTCWSSWRRWDTKCRSC